MHPLIRKLVSRYVPRRCAQALRRWHAPRVAARFQDADWPYAEFVRSIVQPGDTVIDVGANMGYITARLAEYVGVQGKVISIEPVPDTFAALQSTVNTLGLSQVQPIHACVSSEAGEVEMEIPTDEVGAENYYESSIIDPTRPVRGRRIHVPAITLDSLLKTTDGEQTAKHEARRTKHEKRISFIKIDVEGHEFNVIRGAMTLLTSHRPHLLIEVAGDPDQPNTAAANVFSLLHAMQYQPCVLEGATLRPRQVGNQAVDYWFRPLESMASDETV